MFKSLSVDTVTTTANKNKRRFSVLGKIFPNSTKRSFLGSQCVFIFRMSKNTANEIESRQRVNKWHIGAF